MSVRVVVRSEGAQWLEYREPKCVVVADRLEEVLPALDEVEALVRRHQWHAVGCIGYEAAPAFDPALEVQPSNGFPLLLFALFDEPTQRGLSPKSSYQLEPWRPEVSQDDYGDKIDAIKDWIERGETYQVNYTFRLRSNLEGDPWSFFVDLVSRQETPFCCYFETDTLAICSASPELFFERSGRHIQMRPMKGTVSRGRTLEEDRANQAWLRASTKDRAENLMIVDMIRNDVGRIAQIGSVEVPDLFQLERYPTLHQMTSTVTARSNATLAETMQALFPCASITGAPKVRTSQIIAGLESSPRKIYTGSIGVVRPDGRARFSVAIRTVLVDRLSGAAEYGVGSGIVWDSESGLEYRECLLKSRVLSPEVPEFSLLESLRWDPKDGFFLLGAHLKRLKDSALYFEIPFQRKEAENALQDCVAHLPRHPHKVRLMVDSLGGLTCEVNAIEADAGNPVPLRLALHPVDSGDLFLFHKTTHRAVYETAKGNHGSDCFDVLLWNERREVTEGTFGNIAVEMDGRLWTPPLESGLLAGTYRQHLIDRGELQERVIRVDDLADCSRIVWMNSVRGLKEAVLLDQSFEGQKWL